MNPPDLLTGEGLYQLSYTGVLAEDRVRSRDIFITGEVLYQLSYLGDWKDSTPWVG